MKVCVRIFLVLCASCLPLVSFAEGDVYLKWYDLPEDSTEGTLDDVIFLDRIKHNHEYAVTLSKIYGIEIFIEERVDRRAKAKMYQIIDGEREFVSNVGANNFFLISWDEPGTYEVYVYEDPVYLIQNRSAYEIITSLFATSVYARENDDNYVGKIRFVISDENAEPECCSNVAFLPGIKASVLKSGDNTLWPPTASILTNNDVAKLALDEEGNSINDVVVDGILNEFYGTDIYQGFTDYADTLVSDGIINQWKPLPYDWRLSFDETLSEGVITNEGVINIIEEIEELAENSRTGKTTIIAHSMGGLLGKKIISALEIEGKANLIDNFVMVGSPQLGTPQAIGSMLHGHGESILAGFIVNPTSARDIAQNMETSYTLLPSQKYFDEVIDPVITFEETWFQFLFFDIEGSWLDYWGDTIDLYDEMMEFLAGEGLERENSDQGELQAPTTLRTDLLARAEEYHNEFDDYDFPESIRVVQIVGWGAETVKVTNYNIRHSFTTYDVDFTLEGDGTVVYKSAEASDGEVYYFKLSSYNVDNDSGLSHKDLMSNTEVQKIFDYIFEDDSYIVSDYIFTDKPNVRDESDKLLISTHSPVLLGAYDSHGNYTGIDPDQNIEEGAYYQYTEDIPGSSIRFFGESFYLFLPKNGEYDFLVQAYDEGEVDIDISIFSEDETQEIVSYKNIPVESKTQIIFTSEDENISGLDIDIDGDSDIDYVLSQEMDSEPPVVSAETQGEEKVTVTLTATDDTGVEVLEYSFDGEEWKNYEESLSFEEVGEYAIYYRATDYFNNISEVQSITFSILPRRSTRGGSHREEEEDESGEVKEVSVSRNELEEEKEPQIDSLTHDEIIPEIKTQKIYLNKQKIERKETLISTTTSDEKVEEASIVSVEYVDAWWYAGIKNFIKGTYHWFVSLFT